MNKRELIRWFGLTLFLLLLLSSGAAGATPFNQEDVSADAPGSVAAEDTIEVGPQVYVGRDDATNEPASTDAAEVVGGDERMQTDPAGWLWLTNVSESQIKSAETANNARVVDITIEDTSPLRFSALLVGNTGPYAKTSWFYADRTEAQLNALLQNTNSRLIDIEAVEVNGEMRFSAIMVAKTGVDNIGWAWYYNQTPAGVQSLLNTNNARAISLSRYLVIDFPVVSVRYAVVMIADSGATQKDSWVEFNKTTTEIGNLLSARGAQLIDLNRNSSTTYDVIMNRCPCASSWWWGLGLDANGLALEINKVGGRPVDLNAYTSSGQQRFNAIFVDNLNAQGRRLRGVMNNSSGINGFYVKEVGGPVRAALMSGYIFEPASTIKVLAHLYAMQEVRAGDASLMDPIPVVSTITSSGCIYNGTEPLSTALELMMEQSDNNRTATVVYHFGRANINNYVANVVQLQDTRWLRPMECDEVLVQDHSIDNHMRLDEIGKLYEGVANGTLLDGIHRDVFRELMDNGWAGEASWGGKSITAVIDEEAAAIGLSSSLRDRFKSFLRIAGKAGWYPNKNGSGLYYASKAGWVQMPYCSGGQIRLRDYVLGLFIDRATDVNAHQQKYHTALPELLREQIRESLANWATCFTPQTKRLSDMLDGAATQSGSEIRGQAGFYVKQVGGPVLASQLANYQFEPSGTIAALAHLHTMQQVQAGTVTLNTAVPVYADIAGSCPGNATGATEPLADALRSMMKNGSNERAKGVLAYFGAVNINLKASAIGMSDTRWLHTLGCAGEAIRNGNEMTLRDAGVIYEGVANGALLSGAPRARFYELMPGFNDGLGSRLAQVVAEEAPASLNTAEKSTFVNRLKTAYKGGGYGLGYNGNRYFYSQAGWAQIPYCDGGAVKTRDYVFGHFIHGAPDGAKAQDTNGDIEAELLREQIRASLSTWGTCAPVQRLYLPTVRR